MRSGHTPGGSSLGEPNDSAGAARIPEPRAGFDDTVPAWPGTLIEPTIAEQVRWIELWTSPPAAAWADAEQQRMVASMVRLEVRCRQPLPTADYLSQLDRLRCRLGLSEGA